MNNRSKKLTLTLAAIFLITSSIFAASTQKPALPQKTQDAIRGLVENSKVLPAEIRSRILADIAKFASELAALFPDADNLLILVDKSHALPKDYEPADLKLIHGTHPEISCTREGMKLRDPALVALAAMVKAAKKAGIALTVASPFRSYADQERIFAQNAKNEGDAQANRTSARAGQSQHQLGTVIDFSPIDVSFERLKDYPWLQAHAAEFGFSISFPKNSYDITGYDYEPWHWRYIGTAAVSLQLSYFNNIQQYLMEFLFENSAALGTIFP